MSNLAKKHNLSGERAKFAEVDEAMYKIAPGDFVTLHAGENGWAEWLRWRRANGLGTDLMMCRKKWGVPSRFPPTDSLNEVHKNICGGNRDYW